MTTTNPLTYNSYVYQIATMAVVNTTIVGGNTVAATAIITGQTYLINFLGTTDFTAIGAPANAVGIIFTATSPGTGTGTVVSGGLVQGVDPEFNQIIPQMLNYAELRIQRDLDIQNLEAVRSNYTLLSGYNILNVSVDDFVTIETVGLLANTGTTTYPLLPTTKDYINNVYNDSSYTAVPEVFCMYGGDGTTSGSLTLNILFGPRADQDYQVYLTGLARMISLYSFANTTNASTRYTLLSSYYPDLLIMASMIYISAYQRNFGKLNDDPQMAVTYESQYQALLRGAMGEEGRKKFEASAWTAYSSSPTATPTRG